MRAEQGRKNAPVGGVGQRSDVMAAQFFEPELAPVAVHLALAQADLERQLAVDERVVGIDEIMQHALCGGAGNGALVDRLQLIAQAQ